MSKIELFDNIEKLQKWVNENKIHVESIHFSCTTLV